MSHARAGSVIAAVLFGGALAGPSSAVTVDVILPVIDTQPGNTVSVPLTLGEDVGALGVVSVQYTLVFGATWITSVSAGASGLMGAWGQPFTNPQSDRILVAGSGTQALGSGTTLNRVSLTVSASTPLGTDIPISLTGVLFNEGNPATVTWSGTIKVRGVNGVTGGAGSSLALGAPRPNPGRGVTRFWFHVPEASRGAERVRFSIYGLDGRRVRTLLDGPLGGGPHEVEWDGRDDRGLEAPAGVYFGRLEWHVTSVERRLTRVR